MSQSSATFRYLQVVLSQYNYAFSGLPVVQVPISRLVMDHNYLEVPEGRIRLAHNYLEVPEGSMGMANGTLDVTHMILLATCRLVLTIHKHLPGISRLILAICTCDRVITVISHTYGKLDIPRLKPTILYCL